MNGKIIVVANPKGGVGKSTLVSNLSCMSSERGKRVAVVGVDKQKSIEHFFYLRTKKHPSKHIYSCSVEKGTINRNLIELAEIYDRVFVDLPGYDNDALTRAIIVSNVYFCPLKPGEFDLNTLSFIDEHIGDIQSKRHPINALAIMTQVATTTNKEIEAAKPFFESMKNITLSDVFIRNCQSYPRSTREGLSLVEYEERKSKSKRNNRAIEEIERLYKQMEELEALNG